MLFMEYIPNTIIYTHKLPPFLKQKLLKYILNLLKIQLLEHHYPLDINGVMMAYMCLTLTVLNQLN